MCSIPIVISYPQNTTSKVSYANMVNQAHTPTKEHAIILDAVDGYTIQEYTIALGNIINSINIAYVSLISYGRICFYLSSKELVDQIVDEGTKIKTGESKLVLRPLIFKAKRMIIPNVCPIIPHSTILNELNKINIFPVSQLKSVRAGIKDPGYSHIFSFRKQMYVKTDDVMKIPSNMQINYYDTNYWNYFSNEKLTCFLFKEEGHLATFCKNVDSSTQPNSNSPSLVVQQSHSLVVNNETTTINSTERVNKTLQVMNFKRPHTSTTDSISSNIEVFPKLT